MFAIYNLLHDNIAKNYASKDHDNNLLPIITYNLYDNKKLLTDYNNLDFFFLIFFAFMIYKNGNCILSGSIKLFF